MRDVVVRTNRFLDKYEHRGRKVVRFEWHNWKRILHTKFKERWKNRKWRSEKVLHRIYREDDFSKQDWSSIAFKRGSVGKPAVPTLSTDDALRNEYLGATFERGRYYSVEVDQTTLDEEGHAVDETDEVFSCSEHCAGVKQAAPYAHCGVCRRPGCE